MTGGSLDSGGSAPARDEILKRNGCVAPDYVFDYSDTTTKLGSAPHTDWDPMFPRCVKYTGCPASAPVVWCPITGAGHAPLQFQGINYAPGSVAGNVLLWKFLTTLP